MHIGYNSLHFAAVAIECFAIEASFKTIVHSFFNRFYGPAAVAVFGIGRSYGAVVISPGLGACRQVAVLTVHSIGDMRYCSFRAQVPGSMGNKVAAITDLFTC